MFVLTERNPKPTMTLVSLTSPSVEDFRDWIANRLSGAKKSALALPQLHARQFHQVALNAKLDVILLVAVPGMPKYQQCLQRISRLRSVFQNYKTIEFYEFNPKTQFVPGLQIPKAESPVVSVWPATPEQSGASFPATANLTFIFESVMKMIKTQISPAHHRNMVDKVFELSQEG
jgi:hypothetical protein